MNNRFVYTRLFFLSPKIYNILPEKVKTTKNTRYEYGSKTGTYCVNGSPWDFNNSIDFFLTIYVI